MLQPSTPTFSSLPLRILIAASGSQLFGSVVRALDFYPDRPGSNTTIGVNFFSAMLHSSVMSTMSEDLLNISFATILTNIFAEQNSFLSQQFGYYLQC